MFGKKWEIECIFLPIIFRRFSGRRVGGNAFIGDETIHSGRLALRGVHFEYIDPAKIHELAGERMGLVAQEVEQVFPDWVETGPDGFKRVTVRGLEALVVEGLRELQEQKDADIRRLRQESDAQIERLRLENTVLNARLQRLEDALHAQPRSAPTP